MRKKSILLLILTAGAFLAAVAQEPRRDVKTKTEPTNKSDLKDGLTTTTVYTDPNNLDKVIEVEDKTPGGRVVRKKVCRQNIQGSWTVADTCFNKSSGKPDVVMAKEFDKEFKLVELSLFIREDNKLDLDRKITRTNDGKYKSDEMRRMFYNKKAIDESGNRNSKEFKEFIESIEKDFNAPADPGSSPCQQSQSCAPPKARLFFGYSYLNADFGNGERESFPLGAQASFVIYVSPRIALGPDISFHTKKIDDQTITRMFFLAKGQYDFGINNEIVDDSANLAAFQSNACPRKIVPDISVYLGYSTERSVIKIGNNSSTSSGGGFTFGAGIGLQIRLSKSIGLGMQADYLGTKFKENDKIYNEIRFRAGLQFGLYQNY